MSTTVLEQSSDNGLWLNEVMTQDFGPITTAETLLLTDHDKVMETAYGATQTHNKFRDDQGKVTEAVYTAIPAHLNIGLLRPGMGIGVYTPKHGVMPAIVSPRSIFDDPEGRNKLHLLHLRGEAIKPQAIGDLKFAPNLLQISILQGVSPYQDRSAGSEVADGSRATASEGGHALLALRSLTSKPVREALFAGKHVVHGLAEQPRGIVPAFSFAANGNPGMLSMSNREITPDELIVDATSADVLLIDHEFYRAISRPIEGLEAAPDILVAGLGIMAAKSQLGLDDQQLREQILTTAGRI